MIASTVLAIIPASHRPLRPSQAWVLAFASLCLLAFIALPAAAERPMDSIMVYGYVWHDWDQNAQRDAFEPAISGVLVTLADPKGAVIEFTHTNEAGYYCFRDLAAGLYCVVETDPEGFVSTTSNLATITLKDHDVQQDFGDLLLLPGCFRMIDGVVWRDVNDNGISDAGEPRLEGVALRVLDLEQNLVAVTVSDNQGRYAIRNLDPAAYYVILDPPIETPYSRSPLHWGVGMQGCHPARIDIGLQPQPPSAQDPFQQQDAAPSEEEATLSGVVSALNAAPHRAPGAREAISGVKLTLTDAQGHIAAEQLTDAQGRYRFEGLKWQHYYLYQEAITGYIPLLSDFWGVAAVDGSDIVINLENILSPGGTNPPLYLPLVVAMHRE